MLRKIRGFTLIELLVVIAIIGLLAAIVLASLNSARNKGADASIKANLGGLRTQAGLYYENNNSSFGTSFSTSSVPSAASCTGMFADPTMQSQLSAAQALSGGNIICGVWASTVGNPGTAWAVEIPLKAVAGQSWCVSNTGVSKQVPTHTTGTLTNSC